MCSSERTRARNTRNQRVYIIKYMSGVLRDIFVGALHHLDVGLTLFQSTHAHIPLSKATGRLLLGDAGVKVIGGIGVVAGADEGHVGG